MSATEKPSAMADCVNATDNHSHPNPSTKQENPPTVLAERLRCWGTNYEWDKLGPATHRLNFHKQFVKEIQMMAVQKEASGQKLLAVRLADQCDAVGQLCAKIDRMIRKGCQTEDELDYLELLKGKAQQAVLELAQTTDWPACETNKPLRRQRRRLRAAASGLSLPEQRVWALVHVQGKTLAQAAMELSCSRQNISKNLKNAEEKMKAQRSRSAACPSRLPHDTRGQVCLSSSNPTDD